MPVRPAHRFVKLTCTPCQWTTTVEQKSDVLMMPRHCPQCGNRLVLHRLNPAEAICQRTFEILKKIAHKIPR